MTAEPHVIDVAQERAEAIAMAGMVEKVARAIAKAQWELIGDKGFNPDDAYDLTNNNGRWVFDEMARAAIAAMREPTQVVLDAGDGEDIFFANGALAEHSPALEHWHAMVDAALEDNARSDDLL